MVRAVWTHIEPTGHSLTIFALRGIAVGHEILYGIVVACQCMSFLKVAGLLRKVHILPVSLRIQCHYQVENGMSTKSVSNVQSATPSVRATDPFSAMRQEMSD